MCSHVSSSISNTVLNLSLHAEQKGRAMLKLICLIWLTLSACFTVPAQQLPAQQLTVVTESGYYISPAYAGRQRISFAVVATNPFADQFASRPGVRVTARASNGSILATQEFTSGGIPPQGKIAFCKEMLVDETPAQVEIRPLNAGYEPTPFKPSEFLSFEIFNVTPRMEEVGNRLRITGEIKNPYHGETGAWITFLYRDVDGKLLSGYTAYESTIPPKEAMPFQFYVDMATFPPNTKSIDRIAFSHNNFQSSWHKLLRSQ